MRWAVVLGTGGLAPVRTKSAKQRTAAAAEKQVRLQKQALRSATRPAASSTASELERLAALHARGALSDQEFVAAKAKLLR
ncbi:MAG: SHOCT domain-containing protein [Solirubrobacteraceae bacterium]